jgi:hypothetical protein
MESKLIAREGPIRSVASDLLVTVRYSRDFLRRIGRKGGLRNGQLRAARAAQKRVLQKRNRRAALAIPAAQRKANARAAALKRWQLTCMTRATDCQ